ncbi:MAG TPA: FemAB family XrtA/PEP-CTERM system-associated protein [Vicinamibacterales bacterium]|nr:FemAB family XrtA/PEP-CTERM system-associated protein [Vicinamibacterales bacterium]
MAGLSGTLEPDTTTAAALDQAVVGVEQSEAAWTAYVAKQARATGYHEWPWRRVFARAFGAEPIYLSARRGDQIVGILPTVFLDSWLFGRALISLPYLNYGGVLADDVVAERALFEYALGIAQQKRCRHVELRHVERRFADLPCKQHKVTMLLPLQPSGALWDGLDRKVRNQVRKAQKSELTYAFGGGELLDQFYAVFARNMRDLGTPVYARRFFEEMLDAFPERMRVHVVSLKATPVAAGFTFETRGTVEIPWASSVRDFNALCPNHLLYWSILENAGNRGCATFDFGRSTPNEGTYKFKEQWGAQPVPLHWEYGLIGRESLPDTGPTNPKFQLAVSAWKKLPLGVATRVGPFIVRAIP